MELIAYGLFFVVVLILLAEFFAPALKNHESCKEEETDEQD